VHSEDAVVVAFSFVVLALAGCPPKGPSPSAALQGERARRDRDASRTRGEDDDDEDARDDLEALEAGISIRALSCKTDRECLTHRCDVEHERCRFPCRDDGDCQKGTHCAIDAGEYAACFTSR
jgi:hypothetical protein